MKARKSLTLQISSRCLKKMSRMKPKLLDVVALTDDLPERGLSRGQVGTLVEQLGTETFEVEFCDDEGRMYASLVLSTEQLWCCTISRCR
jgi:hypothetical protein